MCEGEKVMMCHFMIGYFMRGGLMTWHGLSGYFN